MQSASRQTGVNPLQHPANTLFASLNSLLRGVDGRVILLRPLPLDFDHQRDDIDVLLSQAQRQQLLRAAFAHCLHRDIHCRIQQSSPSKTRLVLWTLDASQKLMIDLWTEFDQFPLHRHHRIPADRLLNALTESANNKIPALHHLPPDIDLCMLIQHLVRKRKILRSPDVTYRIAFACDRLKSWSPESEPQYLSRDLLHSLRNVADRLPQAIVITPNFIAIAQEYLLSRLTNVPGNRGLQILERRNWKSVVTGLRKTILQSRPTVAFVGSDGAGKSSVVSAIAEQQRDITPLVAKKLYRRSLIYRLVSGVVQRLVGINRDRFDSSVSIPITIRALMASWVHTIIRSKRQTPVLDRSIASFLIVNRKSDLPRTSIAAIWIEPLIPPVTSVLLTVQHSELKRRKNEMSAPGHETYQRLLFEQGLRQQPTDVILLASLESSRATAIVVAELLRPDSNSIDDSHKLSQNRKAAA